jgi:hypothetical protein
MPEVKSSFQHVVVLGFAFSWIANNYALKTFYNYSHQTMETPCLLDSAAAFLKFAKNVASTIDEHRPTVRPEALEILRRAINTESFAIINFVVFECVKTGISFKDVEWFCRKNNLKCWLIATNLVNTELGAKTFTEAPAEFQLMISTHRSYDVFASFFAESKYVDNFNRLSKCGYAQVKEGDAVPPDTHYVKMKFVP